jgi:hypothetical protein
MTIIQTETLPEIFLALPYRFAVSSALWRSGQKRLGGQTMKAQVVFLESGKDKGPSFAVESSGGKRSGAEFYRHPGEQPF